MNTSAFHLNLLAEGERLSSSPVRLRVMLPIGALLACAAMFVWWGTLFTQKLLASAQAESIRETLQSRGEDHAAVIREMELVRELRLQTEQLASYSNGVRHLAAPLARLAEVMPLKVQLTELIISRPPPLNLTPPKGKKGPPLWGPTGNTEQATLILSGRTTKETPVISLLEALEEPAFRSLITTSKKIKSFRQDTSANAGRNLLAFEIEYKMPERRFAK